MPWRAAPVAWGWRQGKCGFGFAATGGGQRIGLLSYSRKHPLAEKFNHALNIKPPACHLHETSLAACHGFGDKIEIIHKHLKAMIKVMIHNMQHTFKDSLLPSQDTCLRCSTGAVKSRDSRCLQASGHIQQ